MTPTLDPQRTDDLRSFLVVEAAASVADRRSAFTPTRRRLVIGVATAALLAGGLVAVQSVGGPAPAAIAIEVDGEWTTIRIADIDADPDLVVQQLIDAGFDAERRTLDVLQPIDPGAGQGSGVAFTPEGEQAPDVVGSAGEGEGGGAHGLIGLSVALPDDTAWPPPPGEPAAGATIDTDPLEAQQSDGGLITAEAELLDAGVRFEPEGGVSIRQGTNADIVVYTEK